MCVIGAASQVYRLLTRRLRAPHICGGGDDGGGQHGVAPCAATNTHPVPQSVEHGEACATSYTQTGALVLYC